tara:strand:- start:514 stop:903 length:390 start_codon:yes stop_codon:yes gene_type:complete
MVYQFQRHYSVVEARAKLPEVAVWLTALREARGRLAAGDDRLAELMGDGMDLGGAEVVQHIANLADFRDAVRVFEIADIQIKDIDRGLLDFPALLDGREVFLCWEEGEEGVIWWHDLETGYGGRQPLLD